MKPNVKIKPLVLPACETGTKRIRQAGKTGGNRNAGWTKAGSKPSLLNRSRPLKVSGHYGIIPD